MLVKTCCAVKTKLFLLFSIIISAIFVGYLFHYRSNLSLLSPLFSSINPPDLKPKLSLRLSTPPDLDYSNLSTPSGVPEHISYLLYQPLTGFVYATQNPTSKLAPASFTKLVTTMVSLDVAPAQHLLTASPQAIAKEPTILGLKAGEQLTTLELIRASISTSANDAAAVLAEGSAAIYNQPISFFIDLMNQKAQLMNMNNTHFANPEGYDDHNQYSTLEDLYILVHNVQQNYPDIVQAGLSDRDDLQATSTHGFYYLPNWNTLLGLYPGVNGLKIAYTGDAGYSTILTSTRADFSVNLILTGATSIQERDQIAANLLDFAYQTHGFKPLKLTNKDFQTRYDQWRELADQIKSELANQQASASAAQP